MRLSDVEKPSEAGENVLPLVNVVFLLLIFFMLAGTFAKPEKFKLEPPQAEAEATLENKIFVLQINADGALAIAEETISVDELKQRIADQKAKKVQVKADATLEAKFLMHLMQTLAEAGATELQLITQKVAP